MVRQIGRFGPLAPGRGWIGVLALIGALAILPGAIAGARANVAYVSLVQRQDVRDAILAQDVTRRADLERLTRQPGSLERYQQALALDGTNARALVGLGEIVFERGDTDRSASLFEQALSVDPTSVRGRIGWGGVLLRRGQHAEAANLFAGAIADDPHNARDPDGGFTTYERIVVHYWAVPDNATAQRWIEASRVAYPESSAPVSYQALGYVRVGDGERARRTWCEGAALFPDDQRLEDIRPSVLEAPRPTTTSVTCLDGDEGHRGGS